MKYVLATSVILLALYSAAIAQSSAAKQSAAQQEIIKLERKWSADIQRQDLALMEPYLADSFFLAGGREGRPLQIVLRNNWLENLKNYTVESFNIDEIKVNVYGKTAVALMLFTQKALVGRGRRDGQFLITDIWIKQKNGWRVAERHSIRVEQAPAAQTKP